MSDKNCKRTDDKDYAGIGDMDIEEINKYNFLVKNDSWFNFLLYAPDIKDYLKNCASLYRR
jgi:hypothetical protein